MEDQREDWREYKKLILSELQENKEFRTEMRDILAKLGNDVDGLKVKAALAGGIAGLVGTGAVTMLLTAMK